MKITLSGNLIRFAGYRREFDLEASTVQESLQQLVTECPALAPVMMNSEGTFRKVHRAFLNGDLLGEEDLKRRVGPGDELTIITAIAGG